MRIGIIGFGKLGQMALTELIEKGISYDDIVVFDDLFQTIDKKFYVYPFNEYKNKQFSDFQFFTAIGYKHLAAKTEIIEWLTDHNRKLFSIISEESFKHNTSQIQSGCFIFPFVNIDQKVLIQKGCVLHNSVVVSHDSTVGESCYISPGVIICGNVTIGKNVFIGAGTVISNDSIIGDNCVIGMCSSFHGELPENSHYIGNPGRILNTKLNIH